MGLPAYYMDICSFAEELYMPETPLPRTIPVPWKRWLKASFTPDDEGHLPFHNVVLSVTKKQAKTTTAALIGLWYAICLAEDHGEIVVVANKKELAKGRAFRFMKMAAEAHPLVRAHFEFIGENLLRTKRGVRIYPITSDAGGEAGSNPELVLADECWDLHGPADERLWAELTPVLTRRNSLRIITSYAGWTTYSTILYRVYQQGMRGNPHPDFLDMVNDDGKPVVLINQKASMFFLWDDQQRMPWQQTERGRAYYEEQRENLLEVEFNRLHRNKWGSASVSFDLDEWDQCCDPEYSVPLPDRNVYLAAGVDASYRKDTTAVVSLLKRGFTLPDGSRAVRYCLGPWRIWQPQKGEEFNIDKTAGAFIRELAEGYSLYRVGYDPYQFHQMAIDLRAEGIMMEEIKQTTPNGILMGQTLTESFRNRQMCLTLRCTALRDQARQTALYQTSMGVLLKKDDRNKKIDAVIAMAEARLGATILPESGESISRGVFYL